VREEFETNPQLQEQINIERKMEHFQDDFKTMRNHVITSILEFL
jgi:hypothetical protein